jgi:hypothetical protein
MDCEVNCEVNCEDCEDCEVKFTKADFLAYAEMHEIPVFYLDYAEFDSDFYEAAIVQFNDSNVALDTLEHIHNLNVICRHMMDQN